MAMTASIMTAGQRAMMEVGFDAYQSKPLRIKEFVAAVQGKAEAGGVWGQRREDAGSGAAVQEKRRCPPSASGPGGSACPRTGPRRASDPRRAGTAGRRPRRRPGSIRRACQRGAVGRS
jgi:hypothetical protein